MTWALRYSKSFPRFVQKKSLNLSIASYPRQSQLQDIQKISVDSKLIVNTKLFQAEITFSADPEIFQENVAFRIWEP